MTGFLIIYERHSGNRQVLEYPGQDGHRAAVSKRLELEAQGRFVGRNIEIAALSTDSLETLQVTHSRYFRGTEVDFLDTEPGSVKTAGHENY
ncbi:hypothetical protein [Nocardia tengchongensis]|uniref:hypothetical protein n=1 Tax=Nocardia tengchongensis TaxID=2055889 RepID=UPI00365D7FEF